MLLTLLLFFRFILLDLSRIGTAAVWLNPVMAGIVQKKNVDRWTYFGWLIPDFNLNHFPSVLGIIARPELTASTLNLTQYGFLVSIYPEMILVGSFGTCRAGTSLEYDADIDWQSLAVVNNSEVDQANDRHIVLDCRDSDDQIWPRTFDGYCVIGWQEFVESLHFMEEREFYPIRDNGSLLFDSPSAFQQSLDHAISIKPGVLNKTSRGKINAAKSSYFANRFGKFNMLRFSLNCHQSSLGVCANDNVGRRSNNRYRGRRIRSTRDEVQTKAEEYRESFHMDVIDGPVGEGTIVRSKTTKLNHKCSKCGPLIPQPSPE